MKNLFDVSGKIALVTGGSRGIGRMIAQGFVENGVKTYITARHEDELASTVEALSEFGNCVPIVSDLSSLEGIEKLAETLITLESGIDILVNNAGAAWGQEFESFPEAGWDKVVDLNLKAPFFMTQKLLPLLKSAGSSESPSRVINMASVNGLNNPGIPTFSYSASKAGLIHLTRHMASVLVKEGVNVNGIAPGLFRSKMTEFALEGKEELLGMSQIPRGRIGEPEDIAGASIYLASRASSWMTGHTLVLDGGILSIG